MPVDTLEKVTINGSAQWILARGKSVDAPLLLHVQAGPGLPIIPEAGAMERMLHLEDQYLVVYWDQRGCGKSFSNRIDPATITLTQLADDIIACTGHLLKRFSKKDVVIVGYSLGATTSLMAAARRPEFFSKVFAVGVDVDIPAANIHAIEFGIAQARKENNMKSVGRLEALRSVPIVDAKRFQQRARLLTDLGGITRRKNYLGLVISTVKNMLFSTSYSLSDIVKTMKGMEFCQNALLHEVDNLNLFSLITEINAPVHFVHGRLDGVSPFDVAHSFFLRLRAKQKEFTAFDDSAHMPHYDEPERFAALLHRQE